MLNAQEDISSCGQHHWGEELLWWGRNRKRLVDSYNKDQDGRDLVKAEISFFLTEGSSLGRWA